MAKYLVKATYKPEGVRGLMKEGAANRVAAITKMTEGAGGKVEAFYFAYGGADAYLVIDADEASALSLSLAVNASGAVGLELVPLITAAQLDAGIQKAAAYRAPGA